MLYEVRAEAVKFFNDIMKDKYMKRMFITRMEAPHDREDEKFTWHKSARRYWDRFMKEHGVFATCGASKAVFVFEDMDYVIKVPFANDSFDYCYKEVWVYKEAVEAGYDEVFAPCYILGHYRFYDGDQPFMFPFYAMLKLDCSGKSIARWAGDSNAHLYNSKESYDADSDDVVEMMDDYYGGDGWNIYDVVDWLYDHCDASDLHGGNFGLNKDGRPMFVDYSGYGCSSFDPCMR